MIVHHLASQAGGGAGRAAENLAKELGREGQTHVLFCPHQPAPQSRWHSLFPQPWRDRRLRSRWARLLLSLAKKGRPQSPEPLALAHVGTVPPQGHRFWDCDIIHLHWLGDSWLDFTAFANRIPPRLPVVWTLHDLNAVSSICHYPGEACEALSTGCGACPWVGGATGSLTLRASFRAKEFFFRTVRPWLVTICAWQDRLTRTSPLGMLATDVRQIANAFDLERWDAGQTRSDARAELGLEPGARYALLGAASLKNRRKGIDLAVSAAPPGWRWLTFGRGSPSFPAGTPATHFGEVSDPRRLASIYAAADLFVLPSREECLAQTGLEALANGTPVLTFADTGPADYVVAGATGLLAGQKDPASLRLQMEAFARHPALGDQTAVRRAFRSLHAAHFAPAVVRARYGDLYSAALADPRSRG